MSIQQNVDAVTKENVKKAAESVYLRDGGAVEIRAFGQERGYSKIYCGWFDDPEAFTEAAAWLDENGFEVYATVNPTKRDLLARRYNAIAKADKVATPQTSDNDIERRRWIFVDFDPERPAKISATDEEKAKAFDLAYKVREDLSGRGMPSILADSGNGYHLYIPVDLPNDKASGALVDQFLKALDAQYSNDAVHVDLTTDNASRISKVYGTTARKGESVEGLGRVHRKSAILHTPESLQPVEKDVLQKVAGEAPAEPPRKRAIEDLDGEWLDKWLEAHPDVPLAGEFKPWQNGGRIVELESCPWNGHEDNAPFLGQLPTGEIVAGCHHNSCEGFSWHDLREHYDPRAGRVIPVNDSNDSNDSDSEEVIADIPDAWEFPLDALPPTTRQFVREGAKSIGCPVDYIGAGVLATLSGAIGDTRNVQIKSDWKESAALYLMIIGAPSAKKSPAMKLALKPVRRRQVELQQQHDAAMERYKRDHKEWKETTKDGPVAYAEPQKPAFGRSWVDDTTVERLAGILDENPRGVLLTKDELSGWLRAMDQYKGGKGSDRQFFLSAHNNLDVAVDRKGTEHPTIIHRPYVSIIGGIQPDVLPDFDKDRGDGLIERFLPCYPEPMRVRWTEDEVSESSRESYDRVVSKLYSLSHAHYEGEESEEAFPFTLSMTPEAKALWIEAYNASHAEVEAPGFPRRLASVWGKLEAYTARLALVLAMARIAELDSQFPVERVTLPDMDGALKLIAYFKNHVRRTYTGLYGENASDHVAADLKHFLQPRPGKAWEGVATELHHDLPSDHKPERPEDFMKMVRAICKRTPALHFEPLQRTADKRPFRISL